MIRRARRDDRPRLHVSGIGLFAGLGALGERLGLGQPLDDFDPEAFQHGAYGNAEIAAPPEERTDPPGAPPA